MIGSVFGLVPGRLRHGFVVVMQEEPRICQVTGCNMIQNEETKVPFFSGVNFNLNRRQAWYHLSQVQV